MDIKRIVMAGGVLATAGAIGFVMQNGDTAKARYAQASVPDISGTASEPLQVTDITLTSAVADTTAATAEQNPVVSDETDILKSDAADPQAEMSEIQTAALGDFTADQVPAVDPNAPVSLCSVEMTAEPGAAAMVDISLASLCYPNERVTFHHNGMMFTEATDEKGELNLSIPALSENAVIIAAFSNGEGALANAKIPSLEFYDRMVVQSKASSQLHINAYEYGATHGEAGHVSATSKRDMSDAAKGLGGFVTSLGDGVQGEALVAEIYTFPTATASREGDVMISVDAEVTTANCGLRVEAQTLEVRRGGAMKVQDLTLPIPECDAVGDFLVLQNLIQDLKVARN